MSGGLDTLTDDEKRMMAEMQAADGAPEEPQPAPEPEPAPAPSEPATESPQESADQQPQQAAMVPQQALHAERERRKAIERQLAELSEKHARADERMNLLIQAAQASTQAPAVAPTPPPDPNVDPLGYVQHVTTDLGRQIQGLSERVQKSEGLEREVAAAQLQQAQMSELAAWGRGQEMEFANETPDYSAATDFLRQARTRQLSAMGITDPVQIQTAIAQDITGIAQQTRQRGLNFGKVLYDLAVASGYQKAAPAPAVPPPAPVPAASPTPSQRVATAQRGAEMAAGLNGAGSAPRGELTPAALAEMSDAEFSEMLGKLGKAGMQQMFGA